MATKLSYHAAVRSGNLHGYQAVIPLLQFIFIAWLSIKLSDQAAVRFSTAGLTFTFSRSGELRTQKLKSHLVRTQSFNVLPLKPGVGQYIAIHATLTTRNFVLISTLPVHLPAFFSPKHLPIFFLRWLWLTPVLV